MTPTARTWLAVLATAAFVAAAPGQIVDILGDARDYTIRGVVDGNGDLVDASGLSILGAGDVELDITSDPGFDLASRRAIFMFDLTPLLPQGNKEIGAATLRLNLADVDLTTSARTALAASTDLRAGPAVSVDEWLDASYQVFEDDAFPDVIQDVTEGILTFDVTTEVEAWRDALLLDPTASFAQFRGQATSGNTLLFNFISSGDAAPDVAPQLSVRFIPEPASLGLLAAAGLGLLRRRGFRRCCGACAA